MVEALVLDMRSRINALEQDVARLTRERDQERASAVRAAAEAAGEAAMAACAEEVRALREQGETQNAFLREWVQATEDRLARLERLAVEGAVSRIDGRARKATREVAAAIGGGTVRRALSMSAAADTPVPGAPPPQAPAQAPAAKGADVVGDRAAGGVLESARLSLEQAVSSVVDGRRHDDAAPGDGARDYTQDDDDEVFLFSQKLKVRARRRQRAARDARDRRMRAALDGAGAERGADRRAERPLSPSEARGEVWRGLLGNGGGGGGAGADGDARDPGEVIAALAPRRLQDALAEVDRVAQDSELLGLRNQLLERELRQQSLAHDRHVSVLQNRFHRSRGRQTRLEGELHRRQQTIQRLNEALTNRDQTGAVDGLIGSGGPLHLF